MTVYPDTAYPDLALLIDGEWRRTAASLPVLNPSDGSTLGALPVAGAGEIAAAIAAAERGFTLWRSTPPAERARILLRAAALLRERADAIAHASTLEQGKPLAQSLPEVLRAAGLFEWDANEALRLYGRVVPAEPGMRHLVLREPVGIVAAFSPWNFPVSSPARKIAGALAAGCAIILKPSEETPAGSIQMAQALIDAGLPAGVLNLLYGEPARISEALIAHPSVRMVHFTGSVPVGKHLAALAGAHMKPAVMELGGHAPVIVCASSDAQALGAGAAVMKTRNAGQICISPTRWIVHDSLYEAFVAAAAERAASLRMGSGLDPATEIGPLANARRVDAVDALVADARACGARILAGGERPVGKGCFYPVTVIADIPRDARVLHEEPFGPLVLIQRFSDLDEAIAMANSLPFGLAAYAFTDSAAEADRLIDGIECGNLSINHYVASLPETPFGGVKDSGYGREGAIEGLQAYTVVKNVSFKAR
ncbi:MAG: NAD-dependent succinate-semialdehyde dehydrogenase [Sphingomonadales bacterium]|nr:NAD-dependent succinate-semialdehyde dehydrogenase [Sphingomonadales bacterium]